MSNNIKAMSVLLLSLILVAGPTSDVTSTGQDKPVPVTKSDSKSIEPKAKLTGPTKTVCGMVAIFRSDKSENVKRRRWKITPMPDSVTESDDGTVLYIGSTEPLDHEIELTVTSPDGELDEMVLSHTFTPSARMIVVKHDEDETPTEVGVVGPSDTRQLAYTLAKTVGKNRPSAKKEASLVADAFREAKARVTTSQIDNPKDLVKYTAKAVKVALGDAVWRVWQSTFFEGFQEHLENLADAGHLGTMGAHEDCWVDIAKGLEKFAGK